MDQFKDSGTLPKIPNFQYHHQPFNYFVQQGPQNPLERSKRLRDDGLGDESTTNRFVADAEAGKLPAVNFWKPRATSTCMPVMPTWPPGTGTLTV